MISKVRIFLYVISSGTELFADVCSAVIFIATGKISSEVKLPIGTAANPFKII